jgi:hypothetical protein
VLDSYACLKTSHSVVSSVPAQARCTQCNIKFVSDLQWFSLCTPVSFTNKTDRHDMTEILLNTITPPFYTTKCCLYKREFHRRGLCNINNEDL